MVAALDKLRSIAGGLGTRREDNQPALAAPRLRRDGDLAILARHRHNNGVGFSQQELSLRQPFQFLVETLAALDKNPRKLARRLLDQFGSISGLVHASSDEISQAQLPGEAWAERFIGVRTLLMHGMFAEVLRTRFELSSEPLCRHLIFSIGGLQSERLVAFFLDNDGMVIAERTLAEGEPGKVTLPIRLIVGQALCLNARGIVMAHNHPSGHAEPSAADIKSTKQLKRASRDLGLRLVDHLIVGGGRIVSMHDRGCL